MTEENATNHDIDVNGVALRIVTWGTYTVPERTAILAHGITASHMNWAELGPHLAARGWYAVAPDLRGRGRSAKPPHGYGIPYHANDLLALCDHFGLRTMQLVGHSLGALIGLFLGAIHPDRVAKLVLIDAGGKLPEDTYQAIAAALSRLGTIYPSLDAYLTAMQEIARFPWQPLGERYFRYDAEVLPDGTARSCVPKEAIAEEVAVNNALRTDMLPTHITAPTLIVRATVGLLGGERGLLLPRAEAERMRGLIGGSRVVEIPDTNHYTVVLADQCTEAVTAFLEG
jgi:lipase